MTTAKLNGVELYYETVGAGPRLVLTHGSWTDGSGWAPVVAALAERYEVVTWDRRGHSRSESGAGPGSRAEDAADLAALIEHLGGGPVHVAGNSYGAIVTLTLVTTPTGTGRQRRRPRAAAAGTARRILRPRRSPPCWRRSTRHSAA